MRGSGRGRPPPDRGVWAGSNGGFGGRQLPRDHLLQLVLFVPILAATQTNDLDVLKIIFVLGAPLPRGIPGEGLDCHFPEEIVGAGPIPARIRGFFIFILALSTARQ